MHTLNYNHRSLHKIEENFHFRSVCTAFKILLCFISGLFPIKILINIEKYKGNEQSQFNKFTFTIVNGSKLHFEINVVEKADNPSSMGIEEASCNL